MKKLLFSLVMVASLTASAASWKSYSLLDPNVTSFHLTNGVGATNIESLIQGAGLGLAAATNWSKSADNCFMFTNNAPWYDPIMSNYWVVGGIAVTQYGVTLPGALVVCVRSNITAAAGVFGVAPQNHTNQTLVVTNSMQNMFADVPIDIFHPSVLGQPGQTTITNALGTLSFTMQSWAGNSNYVTFEIVPVVTDPPDATRKSVQYPYGSTKGLEVTAAGSYGQVGVGGVDIAAISLSVTNWNSTVPFNAAVSIPAAPFLGAKALRVRSATVGTAAASGTADMWISNLRFSGLAQY